MTIRLLDFQMSRYPEWANELARYRETYGAIFDCRDSADDTLRGWLDEADIILYHLGEAGHVDPLREEASRPRTYVVFSGGDNLGAKTGLERTGSPSLFCIGRQGLRTLLPQLLAKAKPKE